MSDELERLVAEAGASQVDIGTQAEADQMHLWWHIFEPLDNQQAHEVILDGYVATAEQLAEARRCHDNDKAAALFTELRNLTVILAASTNGRLCAQRRWQQSGRRWPLGGLY